MLRVDSMLASPLAGIGICFLTIVLTGADFLSFALAELTGEIFSLVTSELTASHLRPKTAPLSALKAPSTVLAQ